MIPPCIEWTVEEKVIHQPHDSVAFLHFLQGFLQLLEKPPCLLVYEGDSRYLVANVLISFGIFSRTDGGVEHDQLQRRSAHKGEACLKCMKELEGPIL